MPTSPGSGSPGTGSSSVVSSGTGSGSTDSNPRIAIDVEFDLVTPDQLRKVAFGLTKTVQGTDVVWTITFQLYERTSTAVSFPTDPNISLKVKVDSALNADAEQASKGLTPAQTAQATGPAAVAVKAANAGQLPQPVANHEVQKAIQ